MFSKLRSMFAKGHATSTEECTSLKETGDAHLRQDQLPDALACYRQALSLNPLYVGALVGQGFVLNELGQLTQAEECLRRALSLDIKASDAHYLLGTISAKRQDWPQAIEHFERALEAKPDFEFAYRDLSVTLLHTGEVAKAKSIVEKALSFFPHSVEFLFRFAMLLAQEQRYSESIACYRKVLSMQSDFAVAHNNLAELLGKCGQFEQARDSYQAALQLDPTIAEAQLGLGNMQEKLGRVGEAVACYRSAISLRSDDVVAYVSLGNALVKLGASEEALACFEKVMALDPESPVSHLVAALSGRDSDRPPDEYVKLLFDQYAEKFDSHLTQVLNYKTPELLVALLRSCVGASAQKWDVLDLGCGTGLFGKVIAPFAQQLVGVDLSGKMLEKARALNIYHRLEEANLGEMVKRLESASFDVVSATDVFIYVGKLDDLLVEVSRLLRPGGLFAFSVESLDAQVPTEKRQETSREFQLASTGRYVHSKSYLDRLAAASGFEILTLTHSNIRVENGRPAPGYLTVWRRPG